MLARKDKSLRDVVGVLKVYRDNVGDEPGSKDKMDEDGGASSQKEILQGLITFLESSSL
jgi:beta-catenin-like protein 1